MFPFGYSTNYVIIDITWIQIKSSKAIESGSGIRLRMRENLWNVTKMIQVQNSYKKNSVINLKIVM